MTAARVLFTPQTEAESVALLTASIGRAKALRSTEPVFVRCHAPGCDDPAERAFVRGLCARIGVDLGHPERWCCPECRERAPGLCARIVKGMAGGPPAPVMPSVAGTWRRA